LLIKLNGESREVPERSMLDDLVKDLSLEPTRIAIELNQHVVRRDQWAHTTLAEGDRVEIVHFVGGGSGGTRTFCPRASEARSDPRRHYFERLFALRAQADRVSALRPRSGLQSFISSVRGVKSS